MRVIPGKIHPALVGLVSRIFLAHLQTDPTDKRPVNPFPPRPDQALYFYPYDKVICENLADNSVQTLAASIIVGPQLARVNLSVGYNTVVIYVGFYPGGIHRLLGIPMQELVNHSIDADLLFNKEITTLNEQLSELTDFDTMLMRVEKFLLNKVNTLERHLPLDQVLKHSQVFQTSLNSVTELAQAACVSNRQLERQFKERIGMSPKTYFKLVRFSKAWNLREHYPQLSWTQIAHHCHYADQMHLVRDFHQFAGASPTIIAGELQKSSVRLQTDL